MGDRRKCQTYAASPAEPGSLPVMLSDLVKPAFELGKGLQRLWIGKWQELHEDDAGDVLGRIDPEIGVGEAGPGEAAGAPAGRRSLGVDHEAEPPFLDHAREEFGVE